MKWSPGILFCIVIITAAGSAGCIFIEGDMCGGSVPVYMVNRSDTSGIPDTAIRHLTPEEFRKYPELESFLKKSPPDSEPYEVSIRGNLTGYNIGSFNIPCSRESRLDDYNYALGNDPSYPSRYLEYEGTLYYIGRTMIR